MQLSQNPSTPILKTLAKKISKVSISELLNDSDRVADLNYEIGGIKVDLSRQLLTTSVLSHLIKMANSSEINIKINKLMDGTFLNKSENRPITHFNLRNTSRRNAASWLKLKTFVKKVRDNKEILDVVNIGIGGSHLGSKTAESALKYYCDGPDIHFASSVDPSSMSDILNKCQPKKTIFIINSKSFKTTEVLNNAKLAKQWLKNNNQQQKEFIYVVTASKADAITWGVSEDNIFDFDEGVGGRFSVWSPSGLPLMLAIGVNNFQKFLDGAFIVDEHFRSEDSIRNVPIMMSLVRVWNRNFLNYASHGIIPYEYGLRNFPRYVQQLEMESNGKGVDLDGNTLVMPASPLIWGEVGTDAQHSFFQFIHQGRDIVPVDILVSELPAKLDANSKHVEGHKILVANALGQAEALAFGEENLTEPHRRFHGNRPSSLISWKKSNPYNMGSLIALYENITISSGLIWGINSFDQWGVELGKEITKGLLDENGSSKIRPQLKRFLR